MCVGTQFRYPSFDRHSASFPVCSIGRCLIFSKHNLKPVIKNRYNEFFYKLYQNEMKH